MRNLRIVKQVGGLILTLIYLWPLWIGLSSYAGWLYIERGNVHEVRLTASVLMMVFGLPISFVFELLLSFLLEQSGAIRSLLDMGKPLTFVVIWLIFYLIAMFQWLVLAPIFVRRVRRLCTSRFPWLR